MTKTKALRELEAQVQGIQDATSENRQALEAAHERMEAAQDKFQEQIQERMREQEQRLADTMVDLQAKLLQTVKASLSKPASTEMETHEDDLDAISVVQSTRSLDPLPPQHIPRNFDYSQVPKLPQAATLEDFRQWRKAWEANGRSKNLIYYPQHSQVSSMISAIGSHGSDIIEFSLGINPREPHKNVTEILDELHNFFREERNLAVDRRTYFTRTQKEGETFREFYYALERLSRNACLHRKCESEECRQDLLVTMIMLGVRNENARKELMKIQPFPDLKKALATCSTEENTEDNTDRISRKDVNKISTYKRDKKREQSSSRSSRPERKKCYRCGDDYSKGHRCTAKNKTCNKCGAKGHIEKACKAKERLSRSNERRNDMRSVTSVFCNVNNVAQSEEETKPFCTLKTLTLNVYENGRRIGEAKNVLPDSGAAANLMSINIFKKLGGKMKDLSKQGDVVYGANGLTINVIGRKRYTMQLGEVAVDAIFLVTDEYDGTIVNRKTCEALHILPRNFPDQVMIGDSTSNRVYVVQEHDIEKVKTELLDEFADVFDISGELKPMTGKPAHIELKPNAKPFQVNGPRPIPIPLRQATKKLIMDMVQQGVLQEVTEPTDWLHPFTVVVKPDRSLRLCVDLRMLNIFVKRPHYPVRTPKDAISAIPPTSRYFSVFDAKSGYLQIELDESSQLLTTFATPWGRFKHKRITMGLTSAGDEYNRRMDAALADLPNLQKVVDDIILHDENLESHIMRVRTFLERCRANGITLNPKKAKVAQQSVKFAGFVVSQNGIEADPDKIKAIRHFPKPTNLTDLRSFVGLVEQLAGFSDEVAKVMRPLRPLLSKRSEFYWTHEHDRAFEETKQVLTKPPILATFDPTLPTMLQTDASRINGLGYALLQKQENIWRLIEANSRFISPTESRYAMVEMELLAVKWAMKKCHNYLFGLEHFELIVDHKPLVSILDKQTLDCIENTRIQAFKAATSKYLFTTIWRKGKEHRIPDALSRAPINEPTPEDLEDDNDIYNQTCMVKHKILAIDYDDDDVPEAKCADPLLEEIKQRGKCDEDYICLKKFLNSGETKIPGSIIMYKSVLDDMSQDDNGLLLVRQRLVVPRSMRKEILHKLHASHQGIDRTLRRARQTVYWPGLSSDVKSTVRSCEECMKYGVSLPKEPMLKDEVPHRIFEEVATDLFEIKGKHFLIIMDRYSGWPEVYKMGDCPTSEKIIARLVNYFSQVGCPLRLLSDGGRQFVSKEMEDFLKRWGINHRVSSPHYHQSNGLAEAGVKSVKALLKKCGGDINAKFSEGYLELRNTPRPGGKSPAEIVYGQPMRSRVPAHHKAFDKKWLVSLEEHDAKMSKLALKSVDHYNKSAKSLSQLEAGMKVIMQDPNTKLWDKTGVVMSKGNFRNYRVKTHSGLCLWRNRRFLKPLYLPDKNDYDGATTAKEIKRKTQEEKGDDRTLRRGKRVRFQTRRYGYD